MDWVNPLIGGVLIGLSAALMMRLHGRIAGISGIVSGLLVYTTGEWKWRLLFVGGLAFGGLLMAIFMPDWLPRESPSTLSLIFGGLLVGLGTKLGSGCTSGHGVCGLARFSKRSLTAVVVFMVVGFATVFLMRHLLVGGL